MDEAEGWTTHVPARGVIRTPEGADEQWQEKIRRAKEARAVVKRMRVGKPVSFRRSVGPGMGNRTPRKPG